MFFATNTSHVSFCRFIRSTQTLYMMVRWAIKRWCFIGCAYFQAHTVLLCSNSIAVCIDAVTGIVAIFSTLLGIAVLSCCMVALRAALYPIQQPLFAVNAEDDISSEHLETDPIEPSTPSDTDQQEHLVCSPSVKH